MNRQIFIFISCTQNIIFSFFLEEETTKAKASVAHRSYNRVLNVLQEDVVGWMMASKRYPCLNSWYLWMLPYMIAQNNFEDVLKNLEIRRQSWIIWVHLKCNNMYQYKREAEENLTHRRGEGNMTMEREIGVMWP